MKINIGCRFGEKPGFIGIDSNPECHPDRVLDLSRDRLPFRDSSVDEVYSRYAFEYVRDLPHLIRELYRVSRNGAVWNIYVHHWSIIIGKPPGSRNYFDETFFNNVCEKSLKYWGTSRLDIRPERIVIVRGRLRFWKKYSIHYRLRIVK